MDKPILTAENYYDDNFYMSTSRFKNYIDCEAKALAIDNGGMGRRKDAYPVSSGELRS